LEPGRVQLSEKKFFSRPEFSSYFSYEFKNVSFYIEPHPDYCTIYSRLKDYFIFGEQHKIRQQIHYPKSLLSGILQ
jgi:hypothetical protein